MTNVRPEDCILERETPFAEIVSLWVLIDWDGFLACRAGISDPTYPWSTRSGEVAASATIAVVANRWPPASNGCAATSVNSEIFRATASKYGVVNTHGRVGLRCGAMWHQLTKFYPALTTGRWLAAACACTVSGSHYCYRMEV